MPKREAGSGKLHAMILGSMAQPSSSQCAWLREGLLCRLFVSGAVVRGSLRLGRRPVRPFQAPTFVLCTSC